METTGPQIGRQICRDAAFSGTIFFTNALRAKRNGRHDAARQSEANQNASCPNSSRPPGSQTNRKLRIPDCASEPNMGGGGLFRDFGLRPFADDLLCLDDDRGHGAAGNRRRAFCRQPGVPGLSRGNCAQVSSQPARADTCGGGAGQRPERMRIVPWTRQQTHRHDRLGGRRKIHHKSRTGRGGLFSMPFGYSSSVPSSPTPSGCGRSH